MQSKNGQPICQQLDNYFSRADVLGEPVRLTYNKKWRFQTSFGAILSVILYGYMAYFGVLGIADVTANKVISLSSTEQPFNHSEGISLSKFQVAFGFEQEFNEGEATWVAQLITKTLNEDGTRSRADPTDIPLINCQQNKEQWAKLVEKNRHKLFKTLLCFKNPLDFTVQGDYYSDKFQYLSISLNTTCDKETCNLQKQWDFLKRNNIQVIYSDIYTEQSTETIKNYINHEYSIGLAPYMTKSTNFFL